MTPERRATFLFADIAGFTALTEAQGDEHAAAFRLGTRIATVPPRGMLEFRSHTPRLYPERPR